MSDRRRHPPLVEQKDALGVYIEALLREEAQPDWVEPEPPTALAEPTPVLAPPVLAPLIVPETEQPPAAPIPAAKVQEDAPPAWAEGSIQALLFKVAGLTLAVPLVELSGIQPWEKGTVTPIPGRISWYLGLMQYREHSVPVVDTAELVLPADRLAALVPAEERLGRVVFIDDGRWGLACDEVAEVITLEPEQVRWRSNRTKRRWLAGTVIEQMCAIIDPPAFARMLATGLEDDPLDEGDIPQEQA